MPASSVIRVAFFALGAAVGGGTVVAINASRKKEALVRATASTTQALPPTGNGPLVEVGLTGNPRLSQAAGAAAALPVGPVLKYGNPGMYDTLMATISVNEQYRLLLYVPGPIFDQLVRRAYIAGYDRRLRHPSWVSLSCPLLLPLTKRFLLSLSPSPQTAEHLTLASLGKSPVEDRTPGDREKSTFQEDESLPVAFRAKLQDYFRSGYDRGHMYVNKYCYTPLLSSLFCVASRRANTSALFPY
jgi:endonuclease G, mitochondrial